MDKQINVLCISDLTCVGRCSLSLTAPVLSAIGVTPFMIPTALLTGLPNIVKNGVLEPNRMLNQTVAEICHLDIKMDGIYTGFLGSVEQAKGCMAAFDAYPDAIKLVDPVMGDNGKFYNIIPSDIAQAMLQLCKKADVITPNITESSVLLGQDITCTTLTQDSLETRIDQLRKICPQPIITGAVLETGDIVTTGFCKQHGYFTLKCDYVPVYFPGTGDLFASLLSGYLACGLAVKTACEKTVEFVEYAAQITYKNDCNPLYGIWLEKALPKLIKN